MEHCLYFLTVCKLLVGLLAAEKETVSFIAVVSKSSQHNSFRSLEAIHNGIENVKERMDLPFQLEMSGIIFPQVGFQYLHYYCALRPHAL